MQTVKTDLGWISYGKDDDGDYFVNVNTEDAIEGVNDEDGFPQVFVYLNDATLYDPRHSDKTLHHAGDLK